MFVFCLRRSFEAGFSLLSPRVCTLLDSARNRLRCYYVQLLPVMKHRKDRGNFPRSDTRLPDFILKTQNPKLTRLRIRTKQCFSHLTGASPTLIDLFRQRLLYNCSNGRPGFQHCAYESESDGFSKIAFTVSDIPAFGEIFKGCAAVIRL